MIALPSSPLITYGGNGATSLKSHGRLVCTPRSLLLVAILGALALLLFSSSMMPPAADGPDSLEVHSYSSHIGDIIKHYTWSSTREPAALTEYICPECNCSVPGYYSLSPRFSSPLPSLGEARHPEASKRTVKRHLLSEILHFMWLHPVFTPPTALAPLFQTFFTCPDQLIRHNFANLVLNRPTTYMYTRTGDGGRLKANARRLRYFQRHIDTLKEYNKLVAEHGFQDGATAEDRQLIWIIIEDGDHLNEQVDSLLNSTGLPYLYFAHGPTRFYGNAQWNAAERAVHVLRDSFFGDGPVLNVDDDSKIMPELLRLIWKVQKVVMWSVGNLGGFEGPVFSNGKITEWKVAGLPNRKFPIDMGGFAYNSSVIGDGQAVAPPRYVPENHFGGESEFIAQIIATRDEIEPLCENSIFGQCHYAWHNWNEDEKKNTPA